MIELYWFDTIDTVNGLNIFVGYQFSWRIQSMNSSTHEMVNFFMNYEGKY